MDIDTIVKDMQLKDKEYASIFLVVSTLQNYGLRARPVRLRIKNIDRLKCPFIPYIPSDENDKMGHFVFCVPMPKHKGLLLDGREEPKIIDMVNLKNEDFRAGWDGTSILVSSGGIHDISSVFSVPRNRFYGLAIVLILVLLSCVMYKIHVRTQQQKRGDNGNIITA